MVGRISAVVCASLWSALALAACGTPRAAVPSIVNADQARRAVDNYDRVDRTAYTTCNAALENTVEDGNLALIDDNNDLNALACKRQSSAAHPRLSKDQLVIPLATRYPAFFVRVATVNVSHHKPVSDLWVMTSSGPGKPWKAAWQVVLYGPSLPQFVRDAEGYAPPPLAGSANGYRFTPDTTCDAAATYFNTEYDAAGTLSTMTADPVIANSVAEAHSVDEADRTSTFQTNVQHVWACGGTAIAEPLRDGSALVIFTLLGTRTLADPPGVTIPIGPDHKDLKGVLFPLLAPGTYSTVENTDLTILAAVVPKSGSHAQPTLVGMYGGVVEYTGTPA